MAVKNCFIRGSVVRYVKMAARNVDTTLLEDATRRGTSISHSEWIYIVLGADDEQKLKGIKSRVYMGLRHDIGSWLDMV
jgi:hypothetical protein